MLLNLDFPLESNFCCLICLVRMAFIAGTCSISPSYHWISLPMWKKTWKIFYFYVFVFIDRFILLRVYGFHCIGLRMKKSCWHLDNKLSVERKEIISKRSICFIFCFSSSSSSFYSIDKMFYEGLHSGTIKSNDQSNDLYRSNSDYCLNSLKHRII